MSVTHAWSDTVRSNWRAKTLGAIGTGWRECVVTRIAVGVAPSNPGQTPGPLRLSKFHYRSPAPAP
jgi:hypothetical protein